MKEEEEEEENARVGREYALKSYMRMHIQF
jgi:hypothetical protein